MNVLPHFYSGRTCEHLKFTLKDEAEFALTFTLRGKNIAPLINLKLGN